MRQETDGCSLRGCQGAKGVVLSFSLQDLENLPDIEVHQGYQFTKEQDEALLKYWNKKNKRDVARVIGVCVNTARARYRELIKGGSSEL